MHAGEEIGFGLTRRLRRCNWNDGVLLLNRWSWQGQSNLSVSYIDHSMSQSGSETTMTLYLQTAAAKSGVYHSRAGNGICHQVHLERFAKPGATLLGSDSHTPSGGIGMIAIGAGAWM